MIELPFNTLLALYLFLTLGTVLCIWAYSHYRGRKRVFFTAEKKLTICEYCHFAYLEEDSKGLSRCPRCSLYNKN